MPTIFSKVSTLCLARLCISCTRTRYRHRSFVSSFPPVAHKMKFRDTGGESRPLAFVLMRKHAHDSALAHEGRRRLARHCLRERHPHFNGRVWFHRFSGAEQHAGVADVFSRGLAPSLPSELPVAKSERNGIATGTLVSSRVIHFPARGCRCLCGKSRHAHAHAIPQIKFAGGVPGIRFGRSLSAGKDSGQFLLGNGPRVRVTWPTSAICKPLNMCKLLHTFSTGTSPPSPQTLPRRRLSRGASTVKTAHRRAS